MAIWLSAGVTLAVVYFFAGECARQTRRNLNEPDLSRFESIQPGMPEEEVTKLVGRQPIETIRAEGAPEDYYIPGYAYEKRRITNKVFIYMGGLDLICYVYIDASGKVEHVFIGGS